MNVLPCGDRALLVEVDDMQAAHRLYETLRQAVQEGLDGVVDLVPGARSVLVAGDPQRLDLRRLAAELPSWTLVDASSVASDPLEVPVFYDGEDLSEVARLTGLTVEEVIRRHTSAEYTTAFLGFAPGFGYLVGSDPDLDVPRLESPRQAVPAGSVALAGRYSGIYPRSTPGGWRLIGRTDLPTWDPDRDPPALLQPGRRVRFRRAVSDAREPHGRACGEANQQTR